MIWKNALRCKRCNSLIEKDGQETRFIKNGFAKINSECDALERESFELTGSIFKRHKYSEEELLTHMEKIKSFAQKIHDDVACWNMPSGLSQWIKALYNQNTEALQERLSNIMERIRIRRPTVWERIGKIFISFYQFIAEKLLPMITGKFSLGYRKQGRIPGTV
jgi:hypothetical protein